jgi:hypothetical protein
MIKIDCRNCNIKIKIYYVVDSMNAKINSDINSNPCKKKEM